MPMHDYECKQCGHKMEKFVPMADLWIMQWCPECRYLLTRLMPAPRIQMDYSPYTCPITGKVIEGKRAHKENMERHGCRVLETGEKEAAERWRKSEEERFLEKVSDSAAREVASWPVEKQSKLGEELARGADIAVERM